MRDVRMILDLNTIGGYRTFLRVKALPVYRFTGREAWFPDEYAGAVLGDAPGQVSRNDWIRWAEACWDDIRETETLNVRGTKGGDDTRHICPLQLEVIDRLVRLYSNPGEVVFSPFAGIGSEGVVALKRGRRYYGIELKDEYHRAAVANIRAAESASHTPDLFAGVTE